MDGDIDFARAHGLGQGVTIVAAPPPLPHNMESEQALLGVLLYDNAAYERLPDGLAAAHFYEPFHLKLYDLAEAWIRAGRLFEPVLLDEVLRGDPRYDELGGLRYLADLVDRAPPAANAADYARSVMDNALRRELMRLASDLTVAGTDFGKPALEHLEKVEQDLFGLAENKTQTGGFATFGEALDGFVAHATEAFSRDGGIGGIPTDLIDLDQKVGGLHPSDLIVLAGRPSMGKAQPLHSKVLLRNGTWRTMGDLRLGDELASIDGAPSRVAAIFPQGEKPIYRVTLSDGRSAEACAEHLWAIDSSKFEGRRVVSTTDLAAMLEKVRYYRRISLPVASGHFGEDRDLVVDPWLLGAMIGNGCMVSQKLSISTADAATLFKVQKAVGHDMVKSGGASGYDYMISRGAELGLKAAMQALGLYGKRSEEKFIPARYMAASRQARLELLQGLMDTDGWVETFGAVRYGTSSERLARDVQALVRSLGGSCTIGSKVPRYTSHGEVKDGLTTYTCNIQHPDKASLISLKRKQRRCDRPYRHRSPTVVSVEPIGVMPAQCIRVTHPSALYVTDDYVVTHNTALATNIAFNVAKSYAYEVQPDGTRKTTRGGVVGFYSLEMSKDQLAGRILSEVSGVPGDRIRKGEIDASELGRIRDAAREIRNCPLHIDDGGGTSIAKITARARRLKRTVGLDLVVVDYLQLATGTGKSQGQGRVQEVSEITGGLKALAKELGVPVIALSQLSRKVEERDDKRPQMSDLRESGSIEQDADMVWFVYREAYYVGRAEPKPGTAEHLNWEEEMDRLGGLAEVIIAKQRHGPIGTVKLSFNGDTTSFGNLARDHYFHARNPAGDE